MLLVAHLCPLTLSVPHMLTALTAGAYGSLPFSLFLAVGAGLDPHLGQMKTPGG